MQKTILITGATDGIGLEAAKKFVAAGHRVLLHGRSAGKLASVTKMLAGGAGGVESFIADLSCISEVDSLAGAVAGKYSNINVLINNAGVFKAPESVTSDGLDIRFAVNTIAPYLLTQRLLPLMDASARVINISSAAQAPVDSAALESHQAGMDDMEVYAQSKLAITMWSRSMALAGCQKGPVIIAVNPGSMLATKMVKEAFGGDGNDIGIGADILFRAALSDEFASESGHYYDNDSGQFASPHPDALDDSKNADLVRSIESVIARLTG